MRAGGGYTASPPPLPASPPLNLDHLTRRRADLVVLPGERPVPLQDADLTGRPGRDVVTVQPPDTSAWSSGRWNGWLVPDIVVFAGRPFSGSTVRRSWLDQSPDAAADSRVDPITPGAVGTRF